MNEYNYRTLNHWEQKELEHLSAMIGSAMIGEIMSASLEDPSCLMERVSNMILKLSYWNTEGDQKINHAWEPTSRENQKQDSCNEDIP
ncbi:hypothetical protein [Coleofasciculus sp. G2-EDA-02]|uniref:hypothetical protein n=1 Tax=Coleofasciculus sp. G2-EDA-02 TaxID=3069529 RepID=UPI0032FDADA9